MGTHAAFSVNFTVAIRIRIDELEVNGQRFAFGVPNRNNCENVARVVVDANGSCRLVPHGGACPCIVYTDYRTIIDDDVWCCIHIVSEFGVVRSVIIGTITMNDIPRQHYAVVFAAL